MKTIGGTSNPRKYQNGTETEDAYCQRDRQQKHNPARECPKDHQGKGRPVPSGAVVTSSLHFRRVRLCGVPNYTVDKTSLNQALQSSVMTLPD